MTEDRPQKNGGYERQARRIERKPLSSFTWNALSSAGEDQADIIPDTEVSICIISIFYGIVILAASMPGTHTEREMVKLFEISDS